MAHYHSHNHIKVENSGRSVGEMAEGRSTHFLFVYGRIHQKKLLNSAFKINLRSAEGLKQAISCGPSKSYLKWRANLDLTDQKHETHLQKNVRTARGISPAKMI